MHSSWPRRAELTSTYVAPASARLHGDDAVQQVAGLDEFRPSLGVGQPAAPGDGGRVGGEQPRVAHDDQPGPGSAASTAR